MAAPINTVKFPINLNEKTLAIIFKAKEINAAVDFSEAFSDSMDNLVMAGPNKKTLADDLLKKGELRASITLPLPNGFNENVSHQWAETTGLSADLINGALDKLPGGAKVTKGLSQTASNTGVRAPVTDPGYFQRYSGTNVREFTFQWDFVIESSAEASLITNAIKYFKTFSAPTQLMSNVSLLAPNYWLVEIGNKYLSESLRLQPMVIKSVAVNYTGSGVMEMYHDGTPKYITLTLTMAEISAITRQTYGYEDANAIAKNSSYGSKLAEVGNAPAPAEGAAPAPA